ncbi:hypothetical protein UFOVP1184_21 [uncultured Caudovirales phage]|uniref:Uncharacterized protein n=1 Tax=uncultured Caudovirales phage TaxID=2100421 RepID=A0A6J5QY07_9CAUD|nr:hypothetical protein UFOVP1184_21 [uncultured Caudovirales phage]
MATAPFQLWLDGPSISTAIRVSSTVTITTTSSHGIVTGSYVQMAGFTGAIGTTMNGVYLATVTSGTSFTVSSAGSAGTAVTAISLTSEVFSYDLLNPLNNYANGDRGSALFVPLESLSMSASGDGEPAQINFTVIQQDTPNSTPWFLTTPDQTRIRLVKADTGAVPATGQGYFRGFVQNISARMTGSGQGTIADISGLDVNALLDRVIVYGTVR